MGMDPVALAARVGEAASVAVTGAGCRLLRWDARTGKSACALADDAHFHAIDAALRAGVQSIEHGDGLTPDLMDRMVRQRVYWCPTIYVGARPLTVETVKVRVRAKTAPGDV